MNITYEDYITASGTHPERLKSSELTTEVKANAEALLPVVNAFLDDIGWTGKRIVNSGFRSAAINAATPGSAANSLHLRGAAIDIKDDGSLRDLILANLDKAKIHGVWFEDFRWTKNWCHVQHTPSHSGHRIYIPSSAPASDPHAWSGHYDSKFD